MFGIAEDVIPARNVSFDEI